MIPAACRTRSSSRSAVGTALCWWMPARRPPFLSDHDRDDVVQLQRDHRGATTRGEADHLQPIGAPGEVLSPALTPRVVLPGQWVMALRAIALEAVAHPASQPQVLFLVGPAMGRRDEMVDLQRGEHIALGAQAVATAIVRLYTDADAEVIGYAHGTSGGRRPRCTASFRACALRNKPSW